MYDFLMIFVLLLALFCLATFFWEWGLLLMGAGVIAAIITMLLRLHTKLDILGEWLEELKAQKEEQP